MQENLCGKMQLAVLHLEGDGNSPFQSTPKLTDDRRAREGSQDHVCQAWALDKDRRDRRSKWIGQSNSIQFDQIRSTSKIESDRSLPDFYYRSLSIPLDHIDLLRFLSILFGNRILANVWLFRVAEIISHYCTNFLLLLQAK